jgi:D-alanyl-lipoteichoic acid acyltransferase DltB (MBOAT superfamily)
MLFNSYEFIFGFLPLTALFFFGLSAAGQPLLAAGWLGLASVFFYGYWSPPYTLLLLGSIVVNYVLARLMLKARDAERFRASRALLVAAIAFDLGVLAYYKYANFFVDSINAVAGTELQLAKIVLPIGISFFTFTQIAFIVDTYQGKVRETNPVHYLLFVTYFPHLIAGPVLHHSEMMPQFADRQIYRFDVANFGIGVTLFSIGLFKKVILADGVQPFVAPVFDADLGHGLTFFEAWLGALAYTMQLYFDFSGYSDMALGLSKMFNVDLPLNFNSPYKAYNIVEFWRRWHMTLSRFLRDYLYIPLGGNRHGETRRYANLMTTMLLGGLWHGAGWTFVLWGGLHGIYLIINQAWQRLRTRVLHHDLSRQTRFGRAAGVAVTFFAVVVAWVFFRAHSAHSAFDIVQAMAGLNGVVLPDQWLPVLAPDGAASFMGIPFGYLEAFGGNRQVIWIVGLLAIAWLAPNSQQIVGWGRAMSRLRSAVFALEWRAWPALGVLSVLICMLAVINGSRGVSEFIYFNF